MTVEEFVHIIHADVLQPVGLHQPVDAVEIDSRKVRHNTIFLALKGTHTDGHYYIKDAVRNGATAIILERRYVKDIYDFIRTSSIPFLAVNSTWDTLSVLGEYGRNQFETVIAITGSVGKTTVKEFLNSLLSTKTHSVASPGNLNSTTGVPLSLFQTSLTGGRVLVQEIGINAPGEMDTIARLLRPTHAVLLNVHSVHLEGLKDLQTIAYEKTRLAWYTEQTGWLVYNSDFDLLEKFLKDAPVKNRLTFGHKKGAHLLCTGIHLQKEHLICHLQYKNAFYTLTLPNHIPWLPFSTLPAFAVGLTFGFPPEELISAISILAKEFEPPPHRGHLIRLPHDCWIFDDSYNSNPFAVRTALKILQTFQAERYIVILGDMLELGDKSVAYHEGLIEDVPWSRLSAFFGIGKHIAYLVEKAKKRYPDLPVYHFEEVEACFDTLKKHVLPGTFFFVKGSRGIHLERAVEWLKDFVKRGEYAR